MEIKSIIEVDKMSSIKIAGKKIFSKIGICGNRESLPNKTTDARGSR
jgi:hypothetical protein